MWAKVCQSAVQWVTEIYGVKLEYNDIISLYQKKKIMREDSLSDYDKAKYI